MYFTCCIFYENLTEYIKIKNKQKNENNKINNTNLYLPKLICINSYYQYPNEFRIILEKLLSPVGVGVEPANKGRNTSL